MCDGSILPVVRYADPAEAASWLCSAFGFSIHHVAKRPDGGTAYIVLRFGENSMVVAPHGSSAFDDLMVQPADVGNRSTQTCYLTVQDVDQHFANALRAGARVEIEPSDDGMGGRFYMCCDPEGHLWSFGGPLVGLTLAGPDCATQRPRHYPALSDRASIGLAVLVGVAVGCGAMFYLGTDLAPKALTAWIGGIGGPNALSGQLEQGAAAATKRLLISGPAALDLTEKLQISQFQLVEAQQRSAEKLLGASEAEYQNRLEDSQGALEAAVRAKELAAQELEAERHRAQVIQAQLDEASQQLARLRADGSKLESRLKDSQGALEAAVRAKELASQELEAERHRAQAIQTQLNEASQQLARLRADGSKFESRLKDSQGALDAAVRDKEIVSRELELGRFRAQVIQAQLVEASQQLARLRADGSKFEVEARQLREAMARLGVLGSRQAGETARGDDATTHSKEQLLRERLRASEHESKELELRARMTILEMDKEAARVRAAQAAEAARTALDATRADKFRAGSKLRAGDPGTVDVPASVTAKEAPRDVGGALSELATEVARSAPHNAKIEEGTASATPRAAHVRPLPQHQLKQSKKWISVASIRKAEAERQRRVADAAAAARKAEEERQRLAAEAARKAEAERQRQAAEAAAAARKAEEERQRVAVEAARKAEAERQRQAAEAAAAARKAEEERQRVAAEAARKAEAERQRQAAEAAAARKAEEERRRLAAEAARKAEAERQRQAAEAAAAARKAEEERQRLAAEATRKAEAERQRQAAEAAAARKAEEERQRVAVEDARKAEAARIAKEAVEAKARADRETRRRRLGFTVTPEDGARFLARGRALLTSGDVTSARLFLERASNAGLADAAMELAETYDPATVTRLSAVGLVGDREQARAWYMRAQALGSSAAAERLKSIVGQ